MDIKEIDIVQKGESTKFLLKKVKVSSVPSILLALLLTYQFLPKDLNVNIEHVQYFKSQPRILKQIINRVSKKGSQMESCLCLSSNLLHPEKHFD